MQNRLVKAIVVVVVAALLIAFFVFHGYSYLSFDHLKQGQTSFHAWYAQHPIATIAGFFGIYVLATALSVPGAAVLTLAAGAIFGLWIGVLLVSFASSIGSSLAFLASRYVLRDSIESRFRRRVETINAGLRRDGVFYLLTLRLIPAIPFFVVNLVMGLTRMRLVTFYLISQIGMLAGTIVYVNAGTRLGQLESAKGILSLPIILSFVALAIVPWIAKAVIAWWHHRRTTGRFPRPQAFDYDLVVIGAGSGGLAAANLSAAMHAKVALVEKQAMGGDCLNTGCVPSKALIRSANLIAESKRARDWGFRSVDVDFNFGEVMERVQRVIGQVAPRDSRERYQAMGVDCLQGTARIADAYRIDIDGRQITTRSMLIATGAHPTLPHVPGIEDVAPLTSDTLWSLRKLPRRLVVVGGGPIGCELAQCFARFGSQVTIIQSPGHLLDKEDGDISVYLEQRLIAEGIRLVMGEQVVRFERDGLDNVNKVAITQGEDGQRRISGDEILIALGRTPNAHGLGLDELGVHMTPKGAIDADQLQRTNFPNIYACGDVSSAFQFTHTAGDQAWRAAVNAILSPLSHQKFDARCIPWTTFTDPEVARVGMSEAEAIHRGIPYEVSRCDMAENDRAVTEGEDYGVVKVLTVPGKDAILGASIVGPHAGELIGEYVLAMKHGIGLNKILGTIHTYPTLSEASVRAAGVWKRAHVPAGRLRMVERYASIRRSRAKSRLLGGSLAAALLVGMVLGGCALKAVTGRGKVPEYAAPNQQSSSVKGSASDRSGNSDQANAQPDGTKGQPQDSGANSGSTSTADQQLVTSQADPQPAIGRYAEVLTAVVDDQGLVDYGVLKDQREALKAYVVSIGSLDPDVCKAWSRNDQIAFWCNAYNALTLATVLENEPADSIKDIKGVWTKLKFQVMGTGLTLDQIEKDKLIGELKDPRIHMAINCASMGCAPLRTEPYEGKQLDVQFDDQARRFLADPRRFSVDAKAGVVRLSKIFDWFGADFANGYADDPAFTRSAAKKKKEAPALAFIARHLKAEDRAYLETADYSISYLKYDWSLNQHRPTSAPGSSESSAASDAAK